MLNFSFYRELAQMQMHSLYRSFTLFIVFVCFFPATKQLNDKILFYASNRSSLFLLLYVCVVMLHFHKQTDKTTVDFSLSKYFFSAAVSTLELLSIGNILERSIRSSLANRTNNTLILILALASCLKKNLWENTATFQHRSLEFIKNLQAQN